MKADLRRKERTVFIGGMSPNTDMLLKAVKLAEFTLDLYSAADAEALIRLCFDIEPALLMLEVDMHSINTYIKVRDIIAIAQLPVIAFASERTASALRLAEELNFAKLIVTEGSKHKCAAELAEALTMLLQYDSIDAVPEHRGHIVTDKYWYDPIGEMGDLRSAISQKLVNLGVRKEIAGHKYLTAAIALQSSMYGPPRPKYIYMTVARHYDVSSAAVEKAIRYAIEAAWTEGDIYAQHRLFGFSTDASRGKPTNAEFIARLALEFMHS